MTTKNEIKLKTLSTDTSPSLSGKSTLRYSIGTDDKKIYLTLLSNSNPGQFNSEQIPLDDIVTLLSKVPPSTNITSVHISPLFRGSSSNNAGFMLAILKHLGLIVQEDPDKPRSHKLNPDYQEKIEALGKPSTKKTVRKKVSKKKTAARSRKLINNS